MENDTIDDKNRVLAFAEAHPYVLLVVIVILIIFIFISYCGNGKLPSVSSICKRKNKPASDDEDEMDDLIESIHSKQKKAK